MANKITVGDRVQHKSKDWLGTVAAFNKRNGGVLVDLSDDNGIKFRCVHINNLEVVRCQAQNVHIKKET